MAIKYYQVRGCNRTIKSEGLVFPFDPYLLIGGIWWGLYHTDDKKEQKALKKLDWLFKLTKDEYESELKKKHPSTRDYNPLQPGSMPKQVALLGEGAEVVQRDPQELSGESDVDPELTVEDITAPAPVEMKPE